MYKTTKQDLLRVEAWLTDVVSQKEANSAKVSKSSNKDPKLTSRTYYKERALCTYGSVMKRQLEEG